MLFEDERPDSNLAIKVTIGASAPSWPSHSTHEHDFRNVPFAFTLSMGRRLTRNEVKFRVDLCHVEPLYVDVYVFVHCVKRMSPWIDKRLCELQT